MGRKIYQECLDDGLRFDNQGRMLYHPDYHPNNGKRYTEEELEYICKFCHHDDIRALSFAIGKPETGIATMINKLRKEGKFGYYKRLNKHYV
jgi:hypothetical protein